MSEDQKRLVEVVAALERLGTPEALSAEEIRELLRARSVAAAAVREQPREAEARLLAFRAAGQDWAVPLERVASIAIIRSMTVLPGVADAFAGLLTIRGRYVTAIDLPRFVESSMPARRRIMDAAKAITIRHENREIALVAEELLALRDVYSGDLRPVDGAAAKTAVRHLGPDGVQVIDVDVLFQDSRLAIRGGAR